MAELGFKYMQSGSDCGRVCRCVCIHAHTVCVRGVGCMGNKCTADKGRFSKTGC